jgi:hypothetical protein
VIRALLIVALILGLSREVRADTWGVATFRSYHADRAHEHNENNAGLGFEHGIKRDVRLLGGFYINSEYRQSIYAGASYMPWRAGIFHVGAVGFVATGYNSTVVPVGAVAVSAEWRYFGLNVAVTPPMPKWPAVAGFQFKVKFP